MVRHSLLPIRERKGTRPRRRVLMVAAAAAACLTLCICWLSLLKEQQSLRSRSEALLADIQRIQVGETPAAAAQSIVTGWYRWGTVETSCGANGCTSRIRLKHTLPAIFTGYRNPGSNNLLARMADHLGLRDAEVSAGVRYKNGSVTGKAFSVEVMLPYRDWRARGEFAPELAVFSDEDVAFTELELAHVVPTHPYRVVRRIRGQSGLRINFMPQEPAPQKAQYMDFRLSCITQVSPCEEEKDILPAASELVHQVF